MLISGTAAFSNNLRALDALLAYWTGADDFATRIARLAAGDIVAVPALTLGSTILNDAASDTLTGGTGLDWFFAQLTGSSTDVFTDLDLAGGEQVNSPPSNPLPKISWDVSINDPGGAYEPYYAPIESNLSAALNDLVKSFGQSRWRVASKSRSVSQPDLTRGSRI